MKFGREEKSESIDFGQVRSKGVDLSGFMGFNNDIHVPEYGSMGFGTRVDSEYCNDNIDFVTLDGLFVLEL